MICAAKVTHHLGEVWFMGRISYGVKGQYLYLLYIFSSPVNLNWDRHSTVSFPILSHKRAQLYQQQVIGDATPDASKLMKREGVRSVPSFHYFKNGEKVDVVNGANAEAIEAAIKKHA